MSARDPYSNVMRVQNRCEGIDTHELGKQEIYRQGYEGDTGFRFGLSGSVLPPLTGGVVSTATVGNPSGAGVGFEDVELFFDSTQRDTSSDYTNGEIKWAVQPLNNAADIKNCIQMHVGPFFFPKIYAATGKPEFFYFKRVFVEFQNAPSSQAVLGPNNNKFHFEFEVQSLTGQAVKLIPIKPSFFFQRPLTSITDFQLRFSVPPTTSAVSAFKRIPIPKDTVTIVSALSGGFGFNPIRFRITGVDTTTVLGPVGTTGTPGIAVFITGYNSANPLINAAVNNVAGVYVTNIVDSVNFEIAGIDASALVAQSVATMYIPKNRIAFPIRFTSVRDQLTNYIEVGHQ
jgi:hypothetical protein